MINSFFILVFVLSLIVNLSGQTISSSIIADHSIVAQYDKIPQRWIDSVNTMLLCYPGESHGLGLMYGLKLL